VRSLFLAFCLLLPLGAQELSVTVHDASGSADAALGNSYTFPDTPQGGNNSVVLRFTNSSGQPVQVNNIYVGEVNSSSVLSDSFTVTGVYLNKILGAHESNAEEVTLSFTPPTVSSEVGFLQATYQIQQNGCSFTSIIAATQCPSRTAAISTLRGNGTAPQWLVSLNGASGSTQLQPSSGTPINFGNISTSSSTALRFSIANTSTTSISMPAVALVTQVFGSSAFNLNTNGLPATLAAGTSGTFSVSFQPGQLGLANATLTVGSLSYPIAGTGVVVSDTDALQISYVDSTGVRTLPQAASPIDFGQLVSSAGATSTLTFTVTNPSTSFNAIAVPAIAVSGTGYALTNLPALPASVAPGASISFKTTFTPPSSGIFGGTLSIAGRTFSLTGLGIISSLPDVTMQLDASPLLSNQQVHLSIALAQASTVDAIGELALQFEPAVDGITDDATVLFLANSGRNLQVNVAKGESVATIDGSPTTTFQTGTTAGTLSLVLTFPDKAPLTKTFTIAPAAVAITRASAVRQEPNLVVTITGFDNTYSAGNLSFTFFDTNGSVLTPSAINVNAGSSFHDYFFKNDKAAGAFSLQAMFPVTGGVTQVGSVKVGVTNSAGTGTTTQTFK
jgi:hypothetical protein